MVTAEEKEQNLKPNLSFDAISKYFNLPLSDAADSLGVSNNNLKKICLDNGLVRWPYRKFLAGKSLEDIIKEADLERKNNISIGGATSLKNNPNHVHEISKPRSITQPKKTQTASLAIIDEFKYGFPSDGLLRTSKRWWTGSTTSTDKNKDVKVDDKIEQQSEKLLKSSSFTGKGIGQSATDETDTRAQLSGTSLLSAIRKRALEEGHKALKLGLHQSSGINKPAKREKRLLQGIFGSSLPKEWTDDSSGIFLVN